jgi:hypothetical protein
MVYKDRTSLTLVRDSKKILVDEECEKKNQSTNTWVLLIYEQTHLLLIYGRDDPC